MKTTTILLALALATATACAQDATWLPANSKGALLVDMKALRANPLTAKYFDRFDASNAGEGLPSLQASQYAVLFKDVRKDVSRMLVAMMPNGTANEMSGVAFVSGAFDTGVLAAKLKADKGTTVSVKDGVTVYAVQASGRQTYMTFPSKGLIVGSESLDALFAGLKTMQKKAPALSADSMIARAIAKAFPVVFVADTSAQAKAGEQVPMAGTPIPQFCAFTLRTKDEAHLLANLTGLFPSDAEATQTATSLNAMKTMLGMQLAADPSRAVFASLLNALSVGSNGKNATASVTLDDKILSALVKEMPGGLGVPAGAR